MAAVTGEATLWGDSPGTGLASLKKRRLEHFGLEMQKLEEVPVTTLDALLSRSSLSPSIIKLDVEGLELEVLNGAEATLTSPTTEVIQFEFGGCNIDSRTFFQDFWYLLTGHGYDLWRLGPKGLHAIPSYREADEVFTTTNFFAARTPAS